MPRNTGSIVIQKVTKTKMRTKKDNTNKDKNVSPSRASIKPRLQDVIEDDENSTKINNTEEPSKWTKFRNNLPNLKYWPQISRWVALLLIVLALWGVGYSVGDYAVLPGGQVFNLLILFSVSYVVGQITELLHLPALLGMLLTGMVLRNAGLINISGVYLEVTAKFREVALCIILTRAGLGLDPKALKSLSVLVVRLAVVPSIVETCFTAVITHFLLGLPWIWGFLLGSILAAVSPAVVIPCLFSLQARGYGTSKGIPTLIVAAASFDDILAISVFGVLLSVIFSTGNLTTQIIQGPLGVVFGIVFGIIWGALATQIPHKEDSNLVALRSLMIGGGGLMAILLSTKLGYQGAGPLGCIVLAYVACFGWRKQGWSDSNNPVGQVFAVLWKIGQPILFSLIGAEVNFWVLDGTVVGYGILSLLISLFARIVISIFIAYGANFTWKEKIFVAWAWFPKATVQAALGPMALDLARADGSAEEITYATQVLIVSVLAILITAPVGAALITLLGPKLLTKTDSSAETQMTTSPNVNTRPTSSKTEE